MVTTIIMASEKKLFENVEDRQWAYLSHRLPVSKRLKVYVKTLHFVDARKSRLTFPVEFSFFNTVLK